MNKIFKRLCFVMLAISALGLVACGSDATGVTSSPIIRGEGPIVSRAFDLEPFNAITVGGLFDVVFRQSDEHRVVVTMSENIFEHVDIESEVSNNHLRFFSSIPGGIGFEFGNTPPELVVYAPMLREVNLSGATSANGWDDIVGDEFRITMSGTVDANINVDVQDLFARLTGASDLVLSGHADSLEAHASGSSDIRAFDLEVIDAVINLIGASNADVFVTSSLNIVASGSSDVTFMGNPVITSSTSGASTIQPR